MSGRGLIGLVSTLALLSGCGGGDGGGSGGAAPVGAGAGAGTGATPAPTASCSVRERQDWVAGQLREWYLFPETLPAALDPAGFGTVDAYLDALTATARSQRRDRFFTFVTSIREENAFNSSGSTAGFGVRLSYDTAANRVFVSEAFEGAPALAAGVDRGAEILSLGASAGNLVSSRSILQAGGPGAFVQALGPDGPGVTRFFRIRDANGAERDVSIAKADFALEPVSPRYGAKVIQDGGRRVGYLNLRTFIRPADPQLRRAFADFRAQGVTEVIVDFRYNGGGLVTTAELMGDLLAANRSPSDVQGFTTFRPEKAENNTTRFYQPQLESIAPTRIAFIGTGGTASASEFVINATLPYLRGNAGLIGSNTFGKPVGQIGLDLAQCDLRLRVVALATQNANRQGDYYDGLATKVESSCSAADDVLLPLGDPREASTRAALDFLAGRPCQRIATGEARSLSLGEGRRTLLTPERPAVAQREVPGLF
jgi:C-terminal processing protease CtpA/Prc